MARFGYLRDPLFLGCVAAYFVNRWLVRPHVAGRFFHDHFNDFICIAFWTPPLVWVARRVGLRAHDGRPRGIELLMPLVAWSAAFEVWLPATTLFRRRTTADPWDVVWYAAGALAASVFWDWWYGGRRGPNASLPPEPQWGGR